MITSQLQTCECRTCESCFTRFGHTALGTKQTETSFTRQHLESPRPGVVWDTIRKGGRTCFCRKPLLYLGRVSPSRAHRKPSVSIYCAPVEPAMSASVKEPSVGQERRRGCVHTRLCVDWRQRGGIPLLESSITPVVVSGFSPGIFSVHVRRRGDRVDSVTQTAMQSLPSSTALACGGFASRTGGRGSLQ